MKTKEFYDHRQAHSYLSECIVMYEGEPVYVQEVFPLEKGRYAVIYYKLGQVVNGKRRDANLDDGGWDFTPVSLGFTAGLDFHSNYASRVPQRAWKIGLTQGNLSVYPIKPTLRINKNTLFLTESMKNTILGKYVSYKDAYKKGKDTVVAFSRRFAVYKDDLYYKTISTPVGKAGDRTPELGEKFGFLKEVLAEDL